MRVLVGRRYAKADWFRKLTRPYPGMRRTSTEIIISLANAWHARPFVSHEGGGRLIRGSQRCAGRFVSWECRQGYFEQINIFNRPQRQPVAAVVPSFRTNYHAKATALNILSTDCSDGGLTFGRCRIDVERKEQTDTILPKR